MSSMRGDPGWGSLLTVGLAVRGGGVDSTSGAIFGGSSVIRVSNVGLAVSSRLRFLGKEPNHDPLRVLGMICSETVSAGSSTGARIRNLVVTTHTSEHIYYLMHRASMRCVPPQSLEM